MTTPQTKFYWRLWNAACVAQRWNRHTAAVRDQLRYDAHKAAGVPQSSKDITTQAQFDAIKNHFLFLADNVQGAVETDHPEHGEQRRIINNIRGYHFLLLRALGVDGDQYIKPIIRNRWRAEILEDVSAKSPLEMLRMDITRAIQTKRKAREWTVHELHAAAELPCPSSTGCVICYPKTQFQISNVKSEIHGVPAGAEADDNVPF